LTPDLSLDIDKHFTAVSAKCLFQLRQVRRIRRSVDDDSAATLQSFVASRVDYDGLLIGAPNKTTDKLQRVLSAAARIVSNTRNDPRLSHFRRRELHWLDANNRVRFRVCVQVWAPGYLSTLDLPTRVQRFWSSSPTLASSWQTGILPCESGYLRGTGVCLRRSHILELYLTVSRTLLLLCKPSNAISRLSYFPHTSTFSSFEVFWATVCKTVRPMLSGSCLSVCWPDCKPEGPLFSAEFVCLSTLTDFDETWHKDPTVI